MIAAIDMNALYKKLHTYNNQEGKLFYVGYNRVAVFFHDGSFGITANIGRNTFISLDTNKEIKAYAVYDYKNIGDLLNIHAMQKYYGSIDSAKNDFKKIQGITNKRIGKYCDELGYHYEFVQSRYCGYIMMLTAYSNHYGRYEKYPGRSLIDCMSFYLLTELRLNESELLKKKHG